MNKRTRRMLIVGGVVVVAVVAIGGWVAWRYGQALYWQSAAVLALTDEESGAVVACEDPGWLGLLKVLEQDLDVSCPATWFADVSQAHLKPRHTQRARWYTDVAEDPARSRRTRFRAGSALLLSGRPAPTELAILARTSGQAVDDLVDAVADGSWPAEWVEPALADRVAARSVSLDEPESVDALIAGLLRAATVPDPDASDGARELAEVALDALGLDQELLAEQVARRDAGLPLGEVPSDLVMEVANRGRLCVGEGLGGAPCLLWLTELLEPYASEPAAEGSASRLRTVWEVAYDRDPRRVARLERELSRAAAWVEVPEETVDRARRLRALLLLGAADGEALDGGEVPVERVLVTHTGGPWSRAVLALELGDRAGVAVAAGLGPDGRVWLRIGDAAAWLDACGQVEPALDAAMPELWPERSVLAQAAVEQARTAWLVGESARAVRLVRLAERLDPVGVEGLGVVVTKKTPRDVDPLAQAAADLLGAPPVRTVTGAETARKVQAGTLVGAWPPQARCE